MVLFKVNLILLWLWMKCQADCSLYFSISATVTVDVLWHVAIYTWTDAGFSEGRVWVEGQGKRGTAPSALRSVSLTVRCGSWCRAPFGSWQDSEALGVICVSSHSDASNREEKNYQVCWIITKCSILKEGKPSGLVPISRIKSSMGKLFSTERCYSWL